MSFGNEFHSIEDHELRPILTDNTPNPGMVGVGSFTSHWQEPDKWKCCEIGTIFLSLSEKTRKSNQFADVITNAALSF